MNFAVAQTQTRTKELKSEGSPSLDLLPRATHSDASPNAGTTGSYHLSARVTDRVGLNVNNVF
jgi:hypothetical protein